MESPIRDIDPEDVLNDMSSEMGFDISTILKELFNSEKDLELKSRIESPLNLARLHTFANIHKSAGDTWTCDLVMSFIDYYLKCTIGFEGLARTEVKEIFQGIYQTLRTKLSLSESLTKPLD